MDYATVVSSALLSVTLSVFAASRVAMRQERGKARQQAQDALAALVLPRRQEARRVELHMTKPSRPPGRYDGDDFVFASRVLVLARSLPWWRQMLIKRRLRLLIGKMWVEQFEVQPMDDSSFGAVVAPMLSAQYREERNPRYRERDRFGLYFSALDEDGDHRKVRSLRRHLDLLMRGL